MLRNRTAWDGGNQEIIRNTYVYCHSLCYPKNQVWCGILSQQIFLFTDSQFAFDIVNSSGMASNETKKIANQVKIR